MNIKKQATAIALISLLLWLTGCGQTIRGMGDDLRRIGSGAKTIFVAE